MKKNRLLAGLLVLLLAMSCVFVGCGGGTESEGSVVDPQNDQQIEQTEQIEQDADLPSGDQETEIPADGEEPGGEGEQPVAGDGEAEKEESGTTNVNDEKGDVSYSESQGMEIDEETGKDQYLTDPVPEGKPVPVEPQHAVITDKQLTCTLTITCKSILDNMDDLDPEKVELVPEDGVILAEKTVTFYEGENVFQLLRRETKANKIHMEFEETPIYNSAYIEGIHNLYEFDCGELSGWMYRVNGWYPNYGCSRYQLKEGDQVEWIYTCDLGRDIGGKNVFE